MQVETVYLRNNTKICETKRKAYVAMLKNMIDFYRFCSYKKKKKSMMIY